jgi:hypothetical protein
MVLTDVSEERIASIFRVEGKIIIIKIRRRKSASEETVRTGASRQAICSSETSVNTTSTRYHIPEDCFLHSHHRENLKSYKWNSVYPDSHM